MPDRTASPYVAAAQLGGWSLAVAAVLAVLDKNPAWAAVPALAVTLVIWLASTAANKLEGAYASKYLKRIEAEKLAAARKELDDRSVEEVLKGWSEDYKSKKLQGLESTRESVAKATEDLAAARPTAEMVEESFVTTGDEVRRATDV